MLEKYILFQKLIYPLSSHIRDGQIQKQEVKRKGKKINHIFRLTK